MVLPFGSALWVAAKPNVPLVRWTEKIKNAGRQKFKKTFGSALSVGSLVCVKLLKNCPLTLGAKSPFFVVVVKVCGIVLRLPVTVTGFA